MWYIHPSKNGVNINILICPLQIKLNLTCILLVILSRPTPSRNYFFFEIVWCAGNDFALTLGTILLLNWPHLRPFYVIIMILGLNFSAYTLIFKSTLIPANSEILSSGKTNVNCGSFSKIVHWVISCFLSCFCSTGVYSEYTSSFYICHCFSTEKAGRLNHRCLQ